MPAYSEHRPTRYAQLVAAGEIPAGELVRQAAQRHLDDLRDGPARGLFYDELAADQAVHFFGLLPHIKGEWARRGETLHIELWQAFTIGMVFGWKWRESGLRRFRSYYEEVPRKNAKSTKAAGFGLRLAFFDDEPGAEVYSAATKLDQAKIVWSAAKGMVQRSPGLRKRISPYALSLTREAMDQSFKPLGADRSTLDGLNALAALIDELHAHKDRGLYDVLETSQGARLQPLMLAITTAGYDRQSICWEVRSYAVDVLTGRIRDDSVFAYIATIDTGDDPFSPLSWAKANPNLIGNPHLDKGSVYPDYLKQMADRAREVPARLNPFLRLHLDVWTQQALRWIDVAAWDAGAARPLDLDALRGRVCYAGLDLANTTDIAGYVLLFPPQSGDPDWHVLTRFFAPAVHPAARSNTEIKRYEQWAVEGLITLTPGNITDYEAIRDAIRVDSELYEITEIAYDPWNATQLVTGLTEDGATCVPIRQGFAGFADACKELERLVLGLLIRTGNNPVMSYMIGNTAVLQNPDGALRPARDKSAGKIDGIVMLLMALARAVLYSDTGENEPNLWVFDDSDWESET